MSPDNLYFRFFGMSRVAAEREARRVCREADPDHGALLGLLGDELAGVASYEFTTDAAAAEVASAVHGRGIATLLLEHPVVGPNCFGVAVPGIGLDATLAVHHPKPRSRPVAEFWNPTGPAPGL